MESVGSPSDFLNDPKWQYISFADAAVRSLTPGPISYVARPQLVIPKTEIVALYLEDAEARSHIRLLRRIERCIVYTPLIVCRGEFHLGDETRWQDMLSLLGGDFFSLTAATVFPLTALPGPFPQQTDLLILNRLHVRLLHLDQE